MCRKSVSVCLDLRPVHGRGAASQDAVWDCGPSPGKNFTSKVDTTMQSPYLHRRFLSSLIRPRTTSGQGVTTS